MRSMPEGTLGIEVQVMNVSVHSYQKISMNSQHLVVLNKNKLTLITFNNRKANASPSLQRLRFSNSKSLIRR